MPETGSFNLPNDPRCKIAATMLLARERVLTTAFPSLFAVAAFLVLLSISGGREDAQANFKSSKAAYDTLTQSADDENNAAEDYLKADNALVPSTNYRTYDLSRRGEFYSIPSVTRVLQSNSAAISHMLNGAKKERCEWKYRLPYKARRLNSSELLGLLHWLARERAHNGDHQTAAEVLRACYLFRDRLPYDDYCHRFSETDTVLNAVLFWDSPQTSRDLDFYRPIVGSLRNGRERILKDLKRMRSEVLYYLDGMASGKVSPGTAGWMAARAPQPGSVRMLWYAGERRNFISLMDSYANLISGGERELYWGSYVSQNATAPMVFTSSWHPSSPAEYYTEEENFRVIQAALAVLQFRLKTGKDPRSLAELVPDFLPAVPNGVFHDTPIKITVDSSGIGTDDRMFDALDYHQRFGEREVIRIISPGRILEHTTDDLQFIVPPLWNSKREEAAK